MVDPYEAVVDSWMKEKGRGPAEAPGADPYEAVVDGYINDRQKRARFVFEKALAVNPDQAAQSKKLMNTTGLPLSVIERNLDEVKRKEQARMLDLVRMTQDSPVLARQIMDPAFTNQAHDDVENLANVNRTMLGTAGDVGVTALKGAVGLPQALVGLADLVTGGYAGKGVEALGVQFKDSQQILDSLYSPAQQAANKEVAEVDGFINTLGTMLQNPSTIATMVGESIPQMLGGAAIGRGIVAAFGGKFAPLIAAAMGEGTIAAGAAAEQFRADNADGLLGVKDTLASLGTGAGTALFGMAGGRIANKLGLADIDTALVAKGLDATTAATVKNGFITSLIKAGVSEGIFEELPQSIQEQMWQNWANDRPLGQGVGKAAAQGALAGFAMGGGFQAVTRLGEQAAAVEDGQRQAERLQAMLQAATGSLLRERNPDEFRTLVQAMADNTEGAPSEVYVDAEVLNQLAPEVLAQLPGVAAQMADALAANSVVSIPVGDVLTVAPGTPLEKLLVENARIGDPTAMSQVEAKQAGEKAQDFAKEAQRVIQQAVDQQAMQESHDRVKQTLLERLNTVGRDRPAVNDTTATLYASMYTTLAGELGITPEAAFALYGVNPVGKTGQGETLKAGRVGEMTVEAYNFGKSNRTTLSGSNFGNGLAGNNKDLYLNAADKRLSKRIYFYVDKGTGINPEAGVGGIARKFNLTNVYDGDTDPLRLKTGRDQLGFESAVLDAGFSGYLTRMQGTQSGQVILLGDQTVTGELLGPTTRTTGKVVPPEGTREAKGRDAVVDAINANTALPAGEAPLWMWKNALSKQPEVLAALTAAGIFDASENTKYYKSELIKAYQAATPAESYAQADRVKMKTGPDLFRGVIDSLGLSDAEIKSTAIEFMTGLPGDMAFWPPNVGGIPDVVQFLHTRRLESGLPVLDIAKPEDRTQLARLMAAEGLAAITSAGNALAWYDQTIRETLSQMAVKYPELDANPHARNAFLMAMAITSQGMNVETNLGAAIELYDAYRLTVDANGIGKFPERGWGESASQMTGNLKLANELLVEMGPEMLRRFLSTPFTVGELTTAGFEVGGELADELVLGSSVFGPKIGFGFYSNLSGNFDPVTMDMWFMRTKGRLAGTLPALDPDRFKNQMARFRDSFSVKGTKSTGIFAAQLDKALVKLAKTDDAAAVTLARLVNRMHQKDFKDNRALFDSGARTKSEMVLASATIIQSMDKPTDAPASGGERRLLRDVVNQATALVSASYGAKVPSAAFQALIWYPEQELYSAMGVKLAVTSQDYSGGARKILEKEGFSEQQLASARAAAQPGSGSSRSVGGQPNAGTAGGNGQVVGGAGPLTLDERTQFIAQRNARIIAEQRAAAARVNFEVAPDPNDLDLAGRWRMLSQQARLAISDRVVQQILPKVLKALKAKGALLPQVGSYLDDTNPSFALRLDKGDPAQVAKTLGFILSQDSMMALAPAEFEGSFKSSALRVQVGEKSAEEIDQIYQALRAITVEGRQVIGGQSTSGGVMSILLDSADDGAAVAALVDSALGGAYNVKVHEVFAAFPEKPEYDYASPESDPAGDEGLARQRARDARAQATDLLRKELDAADAAELAPGGDPAPGEQADRPLEQGPRGTFNPKTFELALNEGSNMSTVHHEMGHAYLEIITKIASEPNAPQGIVDQVERFLKWQKIPDIATWQAMTLDQKRPHHEALAENYEHYLLTGKAPSVELQPLFRKLKSYMLNAYRTLKAFFEANPNVEQKLPPEMVQFYDRMLATEEQIAQAEEVAGLLPEEDATAEALEKLTARSLRDLKWTVNARNKAIKELQKQAATLRKGVEAEVRAEVEEMPVYLAMDARERALQAFAEDPVAVDAGLDSIATQYGYTSLDHMMREIENAQPKADVIRGMTDQRMLERHGDLIDQRAVEQAANEAVHNEARARSLATELKTQAEMLNTRTDTGRTNAQGGKITVNALMAAAKQFGANIAGRTVIREIRAKARQHLAAEARAGKAWQKATSGAKTEDAVKAKQDQVLNNGAVKALLDANTQVRKLLEYLKKFDTEGTRKKLPPEYVDQIDKLLERVDLRVSTTGKEIDRRASLAKWIQSQQDIGLDPILPDNLLEDIQLKSYKEMTFDEFVELTESIKNIEHLGRLKSKLLAAKDKREFDTIVQEWADSIRANGGKPKPVRLEPDSRVVQFFKGAWAEHRKLNSLIRQMDGGEAGGPGFRFLIQSMNERGTQEDVASEKATMALAKIFARVDTLPGGLSGDKRFIPEINNSLSRAGRLAIALNWGNAQNRQRVMGGDNWTEAQVNAILKTLTPVELEFVNDIWAHIDSYWPDVKAKQLRVSGTVEEKVEAEPFEINGVQMRGGYYPIKYDPDRSIRAQINEAKEIATDMLRGAILRPTTRRGHTKARVEEVQGRPIRKDLAPITQHVSQVVHDLAWHEWAVDANRLLSDPRISAAIREHHGAEIHRAMTESVEAIVVGDLAKQTTIDKLLLQMRANVTRSIMGVSATTALLQPFGLTQSMARIGVLPVLKGAARWAGDAARMESTVGWIHGKSEFMRLRAKTFNRELREINQTIQGKWKATKVLDAVLFAPMQKMQMVADVPTWVGMYEKARAEGRDEDTAVALADEAVLSSQGGGGTQDLAGVQRNLPFLTQFYSYFSTTLNLVAEKTALTNFKNPRAVAGWVGDMTLLAIIPAILPALITYALKGGGEDDEPEDIAKKLAEWQASYLLGMFVGLRELPTLWSPFDYGGPPAAKLLNDGKRLVQQAGQGEIDDPAVLAAIGFLGTALGLPTTQIIRSYKGWKAWDEGDAPPTSILFGPPPKN